MVASSSAWRTSIASKCGAFARPSCVKSETPRRGSTSLAPHVCGSLRAPSRRHAGPFRERSRRFKTVAGLELETNVPDAKLALYELGRVWPQALRLDDLAERVAERLGSPPSSEKLAKLLLDSGASVAARAFFRPPTCLRAPSPLPKTTALARLEARRGVEVTNLHHEPVKVNVAFHRELLVLLDGTRDREALARELSDALEAGRVAVPGIDPKERSRWEGLIRARSMQESNASRASRSCSRDPS